MKMMVGIKRLFYIVILIFTLVPPTFPADVTVYVTKTGTKYHRESCSYLSSSKIAVSLEQGYEQCSRYRPSILDQSESPDTTNIPDSSYEILALPDYEENDPVFFYSGFTLKYNEQHEQAEWVAYLLTDDEVAGTIERTDNFKADPNIQTGSAALSDYRGSGYERGHLAPAADMKWSEDAMDESFFMSNMSPQDPGFNRGIWKSLEGLVRDWAVENKEVYVVTGPVLTDGPYEMIGENGVAVPKRFFKVILDLMAPEFKAIGFIFSNERSNQELMDFIVSVDEVEAESRIDFFHLLSDNTEEFLESTANVNQWDW
jgi:endonuclease G, mitochondrial